MSFSIFDVYPSNFDRMNYLKSASCKGHQDATFGKGPSLPGLTKRVVFEEILKFWKIVFWMFTLQTLIAGKCTALIRVANFAAHLLCFEVFFEDFSKNRQKAIKKQEKCPPNPKKGPRLGNLSARRECNWRRGTQNLLKNCFCPYFEGFFPNMLF